MAEAKLKAIMMWTFISEIEVPADIQNILIDGEKPEIACKTIRDVAVVTNKRIIIADKKGFTGKKVPK